MVDNLPLLVAAETSRAGVYRIAKEKDSDDPGVLFAVTPDPKETEDLDTFTDKQIDERLALPVVHITAGDDAGVYAGGGRLKREWTTSVLLLVLAVVAFETVLAWYCGRGW
jgi:hypothetical protein